MTYKLRFLLGCAAFLPILHAGPISVYDLAAGDEGNNWSVQGAGVVNTWTCKTSPQMTENTRSRRRSSQ